MNSKKLTQTHNEYLHLLTYYLTKSIYKGIRNIYKKAYNEYNKNKQNYIQKQYGVTTIFQIYLKKIKDWNTNTIELEVSKITTDTNCNYLNKILEANVKSMINIMLYDNSITNKTIQVELPTLSDFIHKCYIEAATHFFNYPKCFYTKNIMKCHKIIQKSIYNVLKTCIPLEQVLNTYLKYDTNTTYSASNNNSLVNSIKSIIVDKYSNNTENNTEN